MKDNLRTWRQAAGLAGAALTLAGCRPALPAASDSQAIRVIAHPAAVDRVTQQMEVIGELRPAATVQLAAKVGGRLERLGVDDAPGGSAPLTEGMRVRRGQVIAHIDLAVYAARWRHAEAAHAFAEAKFRDAERELQRARALFHEGSIPQQALDQAMTAHDLAAATLAQSDAALALARIEWSESRLTSPLDGVVTRKLMDEGNLVAPGTPLAIIEDTSRIRVLAHVPERHVSRIAAGCTHAAVYVGAQPESPISSVVSTVYPGIDPATRTATVELLLENADGQLRSGHFAKIVLDLATLSNTVVVPASAIRFYGDEAYVYVAEDGRARRRLVRVGARDGDRRQIVVGLREGEQLIHWAATELQDGDLVAISGGPLP